MKKIFTALAVAAFTVLACFGYVRFEWKREVARKDLAHKSMLAPYQRDLQIGMTRTEIDKYLASKNELRVTTRGEKPTDGARYEVSRFQEPGDGWVCDRWDVFVALEFNSKIGSQQVAYPSDTLRDIHVGQTGHCL